MNAFLSFGLWLVISPVAYYHSETLLHVFMVLFVGCGFLSWYSFFLRNRRIISWAYLGLAVSVPIWGTFLIHKSWDFILWFH
jgi:4-hydroxybenzoate polyprenyltransferase